VALGATGFAAAVTLLMMLAPAGAGAVHPLKVYSPAYKHTTSSGGVSYSVQGCTKAKASNGVWHPATGVITALDSAAGTSCGKGPGKFVGSASSATVGSYVQIGIPITVSHSGNNSIGTSWSVNLASVFSVTAPPCPTMNVNVNPPLNSYSSAYCQTGTSASFDPYSTVIDLSNSSWASNYSYGYIYNNSGWQNYSSCSNYGTPSCYNSTGPFNNGYNFGYNEVGFGAFGFNGASAFTLWNNGTSMVKSHHYLLLVSLSIYVGAFAETWNLASGWAATSSASFNMATLGNGATLTSITVA
jgi:hypothetical protein